MEVAVSSRRSFQDHIWSQITDQKEITGNPLLLLRSGASCTGHMQFQGISACGDREAKTLVTVLRQEKVLVVAHKGARALA